MDGLLRAEQNECEWRLCAGNLWQGESILLVEAAHYVRSDRLWRPLNWLMRREVLKVNWDALGAIAELIAASAVLITLLLLLKQLRISNAQSEQANDLARANSQRDILKQVAQHSTLVIGNSDLHVDIKACYGSWDDASTSARWNFDGWAASYFYIMEQAVYMHNQGLLSEETYNAMEEGAIRIIDTPGGSQWWDRKFEHFGAGISNRINERRPASRDA